MKKTILLSVIMLSMVGFAMANGGPHGHNHGHHKMHHHHPHHHAHHK